MAARELRLTAAPVFAPLLQPARYKGAFGGRGGGKSHFFAELMIARCLTAGTRAVCLREVQKDLRDSSKLLIEDKIRAFGLTEADGFIVQRELIETPGGGQIIFRGMRDYNAESVKSLEGSDIAWVEEAQSLSAHSLQLLRLTIRKDPKDGRLGSELWFSWNARHATDPVDDMLRGNAPRKEGESWFPPTGAVVVRANWSDNPWLPAVLAQERRDWLRDTPDQYSHIWEGGYATVLAGAYYAQAMAQARLEGRIGRVARNPLMQVRAFWDIGTRDATAIWIAQFVGLTILVLDYYEAVGQPLGAHIEWLRSRGYGNALQVLPHDGNRDDSVQAIRYEDHVRAAGFDVMTVPNQGKGAAMKRIETARKVWPMVWINEAKCGGGLASLGWYHEKRDPARKIGLGPDHDWSSHGADAFGLMCVAYETPPDRKPPAEMPTFSAGGWMG